LLTEKMAAAGGSGMETNRIREFMKVGQKSFFMAGACTECHKIPSEDDSIKTCSNCRLVWYCGKECQKNNWTYHKELCKATKSVAEDLGGPGTYLLETARDAVGRQDMHFVEYLNEITAAVEKKLNRRLDALEGKIIQSSKVCLICKSTKHADLKPCKICYLVFYCSEDHANQDSVRHSKFCPEYLLTLKCYHLVATEGMPLAGAMPFRLPRVSEYKAISGTTMKDYAKPTFEPEIDACLSEYVSYSLSLLYGLEHIDIKGGTKKIYEKKELTVLMLDAYNGQFGSMEHCTTWEYLLHLLPKLREINIILNEPNNKTLVGGDYGYFDVNLCSDCLSKKCKINVTVIKGYDSYKCATVHRKPDVIYNHVCYSKQLFFVDDKQDYLPYPEPDVPLILLGTDKHTMEHTVRIMKKMVKLKISLPLQENPFRGMRPVKTPDDIFENGSFLYYINPFILAMQRKVKGKV
ncbi:unnamed protein product, partial [Meganyctiphanes norvegica]